MASDSKTGKAGKLTVEGTALTITGWKCKVTKEFAKSTDSSNYNVANEQLDGSQLAGERAAEGTIEGHWSAANTPSNLIARLNSDDTVALALNFDASTGFATFEADISDFETGVVIPGAETIDFSASYKSNGAITLVGT